MKIQRLVEALGAQLSNHRVGKGLLYASPPSLLLRGFSFESSGFEAGAFYLWAFVQPLYVPKDHQVFTFGRRLGGRAGTRWVLDPENWALIEQDVLHHILAEGMPFVKSLDSPGKLAAAAEKYPGPEDDHWRWFEDDSNVIEDRAYSWILADNPEKARMDLNYLVSDAELKPEEDWEFAIQERARQVLAALDRSPSEARSILKLWATETGQSLRLETE